jgi:DNA recombination protein RmuC
MTLILVLLACALAGMVVAVLLLVVGSRTESARLRVQLAELGARVREVAASAQDLPRTVAEGAALQARSIADVREHLGRLAEATSRLEALGQSVRDVEDLLKIPHLRGTVGEVWLEELLRQVFPASCYQMQYGFRTGERVDAALFIGERIVPVDAKFPLEACRRMIEADDDAQVRERRAFRRSLRERVDEIAERYIRPDEGTFDFALMYVPAEAVYYEAVVRDEVFEDTESISAYALGRRVLPVSPHTFYAFLTAVLHGLRGLEVERRSGEILESLSALEQHFDRFRRSYELVGRHLDHAIRQYQESSRLWERASAHLSAIASVGADDAGAEQKLGPAASERLPD